MPAYTCGTLPGARTHQKRRLKYRVSPSIADH